MSTVHSTSAAGPFPANPPAGGRSAWRRPCRRLCPEPAGPWRQRRRATGYAVRRLSQRRPYRYARDALRGGCGGLAVSSRVELAVKMAFITVYRYEQTGQDEWQDGVLVGTRIETNDNGKKSLVVAKSERGQTRGPGPDRQLRHRSAPMTDLSFWNEAITQAPPVIDSQTGRADQHRGQPSSPRRIQVLGQTVETAPVHHGRRPRAVRARSGTTLPASW